jgi:hypothetical protein
VIQPFTDADQQTLTNVIGVEIDQLIEIAEGAIGIIGI